MSQIAKAPTVKWMVGVLVTICATVLLILEIVKCQQSYYGGCAAYDPRGCLCFLMLHISTVPTVTRMVGVLVMICTTVIDFCSSRSQECQQSQGWVSLSRSMHLSLFLMLQILTASTVAIMVGVLAVCFVPCTAQRHR